MLALLQVLFLVVRIFVAAAVAVGGGGAIVHMCDVSTVAPRFRQTKELSIEFSPRDVGVSAAWLVLELEGVRTGSVHAWQSCSMIIIRRLTGFWFLVC